MARHESSRREGGSGGACHREAATAPIAATVGQSTLKHPKFIAREGGGVATPYSASSILLP